MDAYKLALFGFTETRQLMPTAKWRPAMLWLSAQLGIDPAARNLPQFVAASAELQAEFLERCYA